MLANGLTDTTLKTDVDTLKTDVNTLKLITRDGDSIAIGSGAAYQGQTSNAVAIGTRAGNSFQQ